MHRFGNHRFHGTVDPAPISLSSCLSTAVKPLRKNGDLVRNTTYRLLDFEGAARVRFTFFASNSNQYIIWKLKMNAISHGNSSDTQMVCIYHGKMEFVNVECSNR